MVFSNTMRYLVTFAAILPEVFAFSPSWVASPFCSRIGQSQYRADEHTTLFAKTKKGNANAKLAALEALEALEEQGDLDAPISKKEQKKLEKQKKKEATKKNAKKAALEALDAFEAVDIDAPLSLKEQNTLAKRQAKKRKKEAVEQDLNDAEAEKQLSKKEQMLIKALELERLDEEKAAARGDDQEPKLSKKELKALKKKEEKLAAKAAAKAKKKAAFAASDLETESGSTEESVPEAAKSKKVTLEDKIRKDRPPPRIRVMESAQPGFISLRLENVGITFRNQEVLKDVTWGVQSGDRIGLVGKNGAGKVRKILHV